jgi:general secretion pathway protein G
MNAMKTIDLNRRQNSRAGVTLIELLVVMTIIGLFAAIVLPRLLQHGDQARVVAAKEQISSYQLGLSQYKLDTGTYPSTDQGLNALRQQPAGMDQWHGPYLTKDVANDPWNHPYVYKFPGDHGDEPDLISYGADGQPGGSGIDADIVSWK